MTRLFSITGMVTTVLLVLGLAASGLQPGSPWPVRLIQAGLLMLIRR